LACDIATWPRAVPRHPKVFQQLVKHVSRYCGSTEFHTYGRGRL
jgi:hypothetical protein